MNKTKNIKYVITALILCVIMYYIPTINVIYLYFVFTLYIYFDDIINLPIAIFILTFPILIFEQHIILMLMGFFPVNYFYYLIRKHILIYIIIIISVVSGILLKFLLFRNTFKQEILYNIALNKKKFIINIFILVIFTIASHSYVYFNAHIDKNRVDLYYKIANYFKLSSNELVDIINSDNSDDALIAFLVLPDKMNIEEIEIYLNDYCNDSNIAFCNQDELLSFITDTCKLFELWELNRNKYSLQNILLPNLNLKINHIKIHVLTYFPESYRS